MTDLITAEEAQKLLDRADGADTSGAVARSIEAFSHAAPRLARTVIALHAELAQARAVLVDAGVKGFPAPVLPPPNCEEQAAQGKRCGCGGSNEMCVCQNVPDRETLRSRAETEASMLEGDEPEHDHRAGE